MIVYNTVRAMANESTKGMVLGVLCVHNKSCGNQSKTNMLKEYLF